MTAGSDGCAKIVYKSGSDFTRLNANGARTQLINGEDRPFTREFWLGFGRGDFSGTNNVIYEYGTFQIFNSRFAIYNNMLFFGIGGDQISLGNELGYDRFIPGGHIVYPLPDINRAYHIAGVYNGRGIILYVDGEPVASANVKAFVRDFDNPSWALTGGGGTNGSIFIEHIATYNRALTGDEIREHFRAGRDFLDYESSFIAEGADFFDLSDEHNTKGYTKSFTGDDWLAVESARNVTLTKTGLRLNERPDAVAYLMGETPYENIVPDSVSQTPYYEVVSWQASGCVINGDGVGLPYSTASVSRPYSIYARKTDAGPGAMKLFVNQTVTPGQTYRVQINHNHNKAHRFYVTWKTSGNATISTDYGPDTAANASATTPSLTDLHVRAPATAAYGEFGIENRNSDAVLNDYIWVDRFKVYRDLQYHASTENGVWIWANQAILYPNIGSIMGQNYAAISCSPYLDTTAHGDSAVHVIWQIRSQDNSKRLTLRVNASNVLSLIYEYYNPVTAAWESIQATGNSVASYGSGQRNLYVEIIGDIATCYVDSTGSSFSVTNTSPVPMTFDSSTDMVIGNSFEYNQPWNGRLRYLNVRATPETTKTFSPAVGDFCLKLSRTASIAPGGLQVSQTGYAIYKLQLPNMTIRASRINHGPVIRGASPSAPTDHFNVSVKSSTDGSTWSSAINTDSPITNFLSNTVLSNSSMWLRVDLFAEDSYNYIVPYINRLDVDLYSAVEMRGKSNSRVLTVVGNDPSFGVEDVHPSVLYDKNGFTSNSTAGFYLSAESTTGVLSIDGSGTVPATANGYRTIEMLFKVNNAPATNDYLFYHDNNAGTIYSIYFNGTNWVSTGFSTVWVYESNGLRTTLGAGNTLQLNQFIYVVAVAPATITPVDTTARRFNFAMQNATNPATTAPDVTIKFVGLYANAFVQADADRHFDILRSRNTSSFSETVGGSVTEPVGASTVTGTWGYKQITVDEGA